MNDLKPISIETAAKKLATAENLSDPEFAKAIESEPRLPELLLFLQWLSIQPGGLQRAMCKTVEDFAPQFGPACLHTGNPLTIEQKHEAWQPLPAACKADFIPSNAWRDNPVDREGSLDWEHYDYPEPESAAEKKVFRALLAEIAEDDLRALCLDTASENLPAVIRALFCDSTEWRNPAPWYCPDLVAVLLESMELHASRVQQERAHTEIYKIIFDNIDYCVSEKRLIKIDGQARTGKSEACLAFATAYPGRVRLVTTPPGTSKRDLFIELSDSVGMPPKSATSTRRMSDAVQYVIRHARLGIIFDEAQFLLPPPTSTTYAPARLDWVRRNVIDRKLPCALVCTPQTFNHAVRNLRDKRGYNFDQILGRIDLTVPLPDTVEKDGLAEILKIHGTGIPQKLHPFLLSEVLIKGRKDSSVKAFEAVCCRARHLARRDGGRLVTQADLETAISEVIPAQIAPALQPSSRKTAMPPKRETRTSAEPFAHLPSPRAITPERDATLTIQPI
jgi:hypothetical protein